MSQPEAPPRPAAGPPPGRYGRRDPARTRRRTMIGAVVMVVLMAAFAGWMGIRETLKPAHWEAGTFRAVDDGTARLTFTVTTKPGRRVVCTLQAFNPGLTEVGRLDVTVGPSTSRKIRTEATVPTFELASSGTVRGCAEAP